MDELYLDNFNKFRDELTITMESVSIQSIKQTAAMIVQRIKNAVQRVMNWVSTKFMKFFNMETVIVNQNYYNEVMSLIKQILNFDTLSISRVLMNVNTIFNNEDNVKKYGDQLNEKLKDLEYIADQVSKITPSTSGSTLTLSTSKLKTLKSNLLKLQKESQDRAYVISNVVRNPEHTENLKYTHTQIVLIGRLTAIDLRKSALCIELLDKLFSNCKLNGTENDEKGDSKNMNNNGSDQPKRIGMESDINIVEESFKDAKTIFKKGISDINKQITEVKLMSESTSEECVEKMKKYGELIQLTYDACQELRSVKPSNLDKFISGISFIVGNTVDMVADTNIRSNASGLSPQSPNLSSSVQTIGAMIGVKYLARIISKGTIANRMDKVKYLLDKMIAKNKEYNQEYERLRKLKMDLLEKERESSKSASEAFIDFCDSMMIAEEGKLTNAIIKKVKNIAEKNYEKYASNLRNKSHEKLNIMKKVLDDASDKVNDKNKEKISVIIKDIEKTSKDLNQKMSKKEFNQLLKHIDNIGNCISKLYKTSDFKKIKLTSQQLDILNLQMIQQQNLMFQQQQQIFQQQVLQQQQQQFMDFSMRSAMPMNMGGFMPPMF